MSTSVTLAYSDIGLYSSFEATRVVLPRMSSRIRKQGYDQALVRFEGKTFATPFRGEGTPRQFDVTVRFMEAEHSTMAALLALFDSAQAAGDARLLLRMNAFTDSRLNPVEVVTVGGVNDTPVGGRAWDVEFTADRVHYTAEV